MTSLPAFIVTEVNVEYYDRKEQRSDGKLFHVAYLVGISDTVEPDDLTYLLVCGLAERRRACILALYNVLYKLIRFIHCLTSDTDPI